MSLYTEYSTFQNHYHLFESGILCMFYKWNLECYEKKGSDYKLTICEVPCWLLRLFGVKSKTLQFVGRSTVWRSLPDVRRCDTDTEYVLSNFWSAIKYKESDII